MKTNTFFIVVLSAIILSSCTSKETGKHLFILSGQSNMARLNPAESFIPIIEEKLGKDNFIVVKDAVGGQAIRRWYQDWKSITGETIRTQADLYDSLMVKVNTAIKDEKIKTLSFIWMQGERDAREEFGDVYEVSLIGLYHQLTHSLNRTDINFIIGRLSDFDMVNESYRHWTMVRDIQVKVATSNSRFDWINTDDLNDGLNSQGKQIKNDLHMSVEGYNIMGKRFAEKAIQLIENNQ